MQGLGIGPVVKAQEDDCVNRNWMEISGVKH